LTPIVVQDQDLGYTAKKLLTYRVLASVIIHLTPVNVTPNADGP